MPLMGGGGTGSIDIEINAKVEEALAHADQVIRKFDQMKAKQMEAAKAAQAEAKTQEDAQRNNLLKP